MTEGSCSFQGQQFEPNYPNYQLRKKYFRCAGTATQFSRNYFPLIVALSYLWSRASRRYLDACHEWAELSKEQAFSSQRLRLL